MTSRRSYLLTSFLMLLIGTASSFAATSERNDERAIFFRLLASYRNYPQYFSLIQATKPQFDSLDLALVGRLPAKVLRARFQRFNGTYLDSANWPQSTASEKRLFTWSVSANLSILDALKTLTPAQRAALAKAPAVRHPKMPGTFKESRAERLQESPEQKTALTPVDDAFYKTQLGKKIEADLGQRADAWSYDAEANELYVAKGDEISKVRVKDESAGVREIQTRGGDQFQEPMGSDTKIDLLKAQGSFLTGDARQATLFGKAPSAEDNLVPYTGSGGSTGSAPSTTAPSSGSDGHHP